MVTDGVRTGRYDKQVNPVGGRRCVSCRLLIGECCSVECACNAAKACRQGK